MKTPESLLPFQTGGASCDLLPPALHNTPSKPAEPFDEMMHRALAKPASEASTKNPPLKKPVNNPAPAQKPKPTAALKAKPEDPAASADASSTGKPAAKSEGDSSSPSDAPVIVCKDPTSPDQAAGTDLATAAALQAQAAGLATAQATLVTPTAPQISVSNETSDPVGAIPAELNTANSTAAETVGNLLSKEKTASQVDSKADVKTAGNSGKKISASQSGPAKKSAGGDGGIPISDLLGDAKPVNESPVNTGDSTPQKAQLPAADATGISAAQQTPTMKNADQAVKVAGAQEPGLPGATMMASAVQEAMKEAFRPRAAAKAAARVESVDAAGPASSPATSQPASTGEASSSNLISSSSQTELRTRALDRTHDMVALHGVQLKQSNSDSLHVVIKPGAGLQLSLQMKQTSEGVVAHATLQSGDFKDLNQHWPELQQRLEQRGIKLAPLGNDSASANGGQENSQRQSRQSNPPDALSAGAFAEFASAGTASAQVAPAAAAASRGWEGWA